MITGWMVKMGVFDTYGDVQLKVGPVCCNKYNVGDIVPIKDGIYFGNEGAVVVAGGKLVLVTETVFDKWDGEYNQWKWDHHGKYPKLILSYDSH